MMENAEEIYHFLEDFSKRKPKIIPQELNDYLAYVAQTGDPVYQWSLVKCLFKEKLLNVITDFYEATPSIEIPKYPNVDPFNYDVMKNSLIERLDTFTSAPFTIQRICELLTFPRKQYNRIDKYMRAIEKNILVVSTREPGSQRHVEPENGEPMESVVNGSDNNSEYNVDVEMEDMSWKENAEQQRNAEPQPSSSDTHITVDDIQARLQAKQDAPMETQEKPTTEYESVTPPELNVVTEESETKPSDTTAEPTNIGDGDSNKDKPNIPDAPEETKADVEMKTEEAKDPLSIPEIKVDDADETEQRLIEETSNKIEKLEKTMPVKELPVVVPPQLPEEKPTIDTAQVTAIDESSSDSSAKGEEAKVVSEVLTSSEESSSSDNTDGNSNSPQTNIDAQSDAQDDPNSNQSGTISEAVDAQIDAQDDFNSNQSGTNSDAVDAQIDAQDDPNSNQSGTNSEADAMDEPPEVPKVAEITEEPVKDCPKMESDNYSISDMNSELPQPPAEEPSKPEEVTATKQETENKEEIAEKTEEIAEKKDEEAQKTDEQSDDQKVAVESNYDIKPETAA